MMKQAQLKDYVSIQDLMKKTNPDQTTNILFESGQLTGNGVNFKSIDYQSGFDIEFDLYFIFKDRRGRKQSPTAFYEGLGQHEKAKIESVLSNFLNGNKRFKWSMNYTSFMSILPPVIQQERLIGLLVFMVAQGPDKFGPKASYSVAPL